MLGHFHTCSPRILPREEGNLLIEDGLRANLRGVILDFIGTLGIREKAVTMS